jgi:CubicO group peptidase (beta-lactamase class C family)
MTKAFTSTAILQLREAGKLDLDQPVTRYLPWFRVADPGAAQRMTLRHFLTHSSGLPTNSHSVVWEDETSIRGSIDKAVRELKGVHLHHAPGAEYEYANMNYVVMGRVVEAVSGESWSAYVARHIFAPLGMTHTTTDPSAVDPKALARPYWPEFGRLAIEPLQVGDFMAPASNIDASFFGRGPPRRSSDADRRAVRVGMGQRALPGSHRLSPRRGSGPLDGGVPGA